MCLIFVLLIQKRIKVIYVDCRAILLDLGDSFIPKEYYVLGSFHDSTGKEISFHILIFLYLSFV